MKSGLKWLLIGGIGAVVAWFLIGKPHSIQAAQAGFQNLLHGGAGATPAHRAFPAFGSHPGAFGGYRGHFGHPGFGGGWGHGWGGWGRGWGFPGFGYAAYGMSPFFPQVPFMGGGLGMMGYPGIMGYPVMMGFPGFGWPRHWGHHGWGHHRRW